MSSDIHRASLPLRDFFGLGFLRCRSKRAGLQTVLSALLGTMKPAGSGGREGMAIRGSLRSCLVCKWCGKILFLSLGNEREREEGNGPSLREKCWGLKRARGVKPVLAHEGVSGDGGSSNLCVSGIGVTCRPLTSEVTTESLMWAWNVTPFHPVVLSPQLEHFFREWHATIAVNPSHSVEPIYPKPLYIKALLFTALN